MSTEEPQPVAASEPQPAAEAAPETRPRRRGFRTGRLEAFSDGVFAIAVTLLVLDIGVSATAGQDLGAAIRGLWPSYLAYVASFSTIGAAWLGHNAITEYLERADAAFVRLNLLLLLFISFLPFPTRLVAEFIHRDRAERVAVTFYGIVLLLSSVLLQVLWRYAVRAHLVRPDTADEEVELLTERLTPGLGAYVVLIVSGLFLPIIAVVGFLGIALYYIIPFRRLSASIFPRTRRGQRHRP
ncbi:MAG TPA: TMEM175 family protein [Streptosporangiaceae bacterium]|nr:TMEM175 family protein [Streptosporangiaceae bacterium]